LAILIKFFQVSQPIMTQSFCLAHKYFPLPQPISHMTDPD